MFLTPAPNLELCDDPSLDDAEIFDLDSQIATLIGGVADITVTFHLSQAMLLLMLEQ